MDTIIKALIFDDNVSLSVVKSTDAVNKAIKLFNLSPVCAAALGRTITGTAFMASTLKNKEDNLTITIDGNGPIGKVIARADGNMNLRGYVANPQLELSLKSNGKLDVSGAVGKTGKIMVVRGGKDATPYVGSVDLCSGEIAEDFAKYYAESAQIPTAMALGVLIGKRYNCLSAGGVVFQPLPGCSDSTIGKLENLIKEFADISKKIEGLTAEEFIQKFFKADVKILESVPFKYKCKCNLNKIKSLLSTMTKDEIDDILKVESKIEVICHFCNKKYVFTKENFV